MATSNVKKRRKSKSRKRAAFVSDQRKRELLGLIMMVLALLLSLAIVTYSPEDAAVTSGATVGIALDPTADRATNALGIVGATIANLLVPGFLGYVALLFPAIVFVWGYVIFRRRDPGYLPLVTALTVVSAFVIAAIFGWFAVGSESFALASFSGRIGLGIASAMQVMLGSVGSLIVLVLMAGVIALLFVDLDLQRTMDRVENAASGAVSGVRNWWNARGTEKTVDSEAPEQMQTATSPVKAATDNNAVPPAPQNIRLPVADTPTVNDLFNPTAHTRAPSPQKPSPGPKPPSHPAAPTDGPAITVRERISEERADSIEREAEIPDDELDLAYDFPPIDLLDEAEDSDPKIDFDEIEENKQLLLEKLQTYNIEITDINVIVGPTVTMYELTPAPGVKISRITSLEHDLAMAVAARGIRMIAPIPGKSAIGVEIPNRHRELVRLRDVIGTARFRDTKMELPIPFGESIEGEVFLQDLTKLPHLLIAGATGAGKSVGLNTIIAGLLYSCHPANLKFVMIDPKKIELQQYAQIFEHFVAMPEEADDPIITDFSQALGVLKSCEKEMEQRYDLLAAASVRSIRDYNKKLADGKLNPDDEHRHLPYIVVIVDELADLMMTAGKDIEGPIARLAQMARAVGIHLVLATQRPSVDVITGLIKANFPARIAYQVASKIDSRTILDQNGAEGLVGNGDMLFMLGSRMVRLQGPFVSDRELDGITSWIAGQKGRGPYPLPPIDTEEGDVEALMGVEDADDLFEEAARIIVRSQQGSVSLLQRRLSVGYTRAARIVDQLEDAGIVGPFQGSKARAVLVEDEMQLDALLAQDNEPGA